MSEENLWTRMVTRPSLKRTRRLMNYNMQQDVINIVRVDVSARRVFCPSLASCLIYYIAGLVECRERDGGGDANFCVEASIIHRK